MLSAMLRHILVFLAIAASCLAADVSGSWALTVESEMGTMNPTLVLQQDGEKLTGTYTGRLGESKVTGKVQGDSIEFHFELSPQGEAITITYEGKIESATAMKGTVKFGDFGTATWSGVKK
jgi:hypothetical protein